MSHAYLFSFKYLQITIMIIKSKRDVSITQLPKHRVRRSGFSMRKVIDIYLVFFSPSLIHL